MLQLYENIRKRREELGLTQTELAHLVGYKSKSAIARIENGGIDIPASKILALANALNTTPWDLIGGGW